MAITYDTVGTLTITADFYNSPSSLDTSQNYAFLANFEVGMNAGSKSYRYCDSYVYAGQHHVWAKTGLRFYDQSSVSGYEGKLQFNRSTSGDGKQVTVSANSPTLANQDLQCFTYQLRNRSYSSASNLHSDYDDSCGCWAITTSGDVLGVEDEDVPLAPTNYFDGFAPVDPPPPPKAVAKLKLRPVPSCRRLDLSAWTLLPDAVNGTNRGFSGQVLFKLTHAGVTRQKKTRPRPYIYWNGIGPGKYKLEAQYLGDRWREPSNVVRRTVKIPRCR